MTLFTCIIRSCILQKTKSAVTAICKRPSTLFPLSSHCIRHSGNLTTIDMTDLDPTSYANPQSVVTTHIHLDWDINFSETKLEGNVELSLQAQEDIDQITLDTRDLLISNINGSDGKSLEYKLKEKSVAFGSPLQINLERTLNKGEEFKINIAYSTSSNASALQWLSANQTAGKKYPYMFSQCQAIHCRSLMPCQDTPSVKAPYTAKVTVEDPIVVLMSALSTDVQSKTDEQGKSVSTYQFQQKVPMPSYLIAIVAGLIESRDIGPRTRVWSEKEFVDIAANEFDETEQMVAAGEKLVGPYVWGRYDLLVLPPTFPYGGMENPCLTFVTPTLLAGDKSLANVVAHEIAHSWTGNLVTNRTWEHFWLNEGHTVFLERKIMASLTDQKSLHFNSLGGLKALRYSIDVFGETNPLTNLIPDLKGIDPDDSFSSVPYEKGYTLLFYLETLLGGPSEFEPFLYSYIDTYKYKSVTTWQWKDHLYQFFSNKKDILDSVDWDAWFHTPGMPPVIPEYDQTMNQVCTQLADRWATAKDATEFSSDDIAHMSSGQKIEFLGQLLLKDPICPSNYDQLTSIYQLDKSGNAEIKFNWLRLGLHAKAESAVEPAIKMATEQGRMKFTRPLFRDLGKWSVSRDRAIAAYTANKPYMHSTTAQLVGKDLKL